MRLPFRSSSRSLVPRSGSTVLPLTHSRSHHHFFTGLIDPLPALSSQWAIFLRVKGNLMAVHSHIRLVRRLSSVLKGHVFIHRPHAEQRRLPSRYFAHFSESDFHIS